MNTKKLDENVQEILDILNNQVASDGMATLSKCMVKICLVGIEAHNFSVTNVMKGLEMVFEATRRTLVHHLEMKNIHKSEVTQ